MMAETTGPILALGAITVANQSIFHDEPLNWRVPVATGFAAMAFIPLEKAAPKAARMLAWTAIAVVLFTRINDVPSPTESFLDFWEKGER